MTLLVKKEQQIIWKQNFVEVTISVAVLDSVFFLP